MEEMSLTISGLATLLEAVVNTGMWLSCVETEVNNMEGDTGPAAAGYCWQLHRRYLVEW